MQRTPAPTAVPQRSPAGSSQGQPAQEIPRTHLATAIQLDVGASPPQPVRRNPSNILNIYRATGREALSTIATGPAAGRSSANRKSQPTSASSQPASLASDRATGQNQSAAKGQVSRLPLPSSLRATLLLHRQTPIPLPSRHSIQISN